MEINIVGKTGVSVLTNIDCLKTAKRLTPKEAKISHWYVEFFENTGVCRIAVVYQYKDTGVKNTVYEIQ